MVSILGVSGQRQLLSAENVYNNVYTTTYHYHIYSWILDLLPSEKDCRVDSHAEFEIA